VSLSIYLKIKLSENQLNKNSGAGGEAGVSNNTGATMGGAPQTSYHTGTDEQLQVTLRFKDENAGDQIVYNPLMDDTFSNVYVNSVDIAKFLERPVLIQTYQWGEGTSLNTTFEPWKDFFNNSYIKNKIENYTYIQCNLNIKVVINASPFYYGAGLLAYEPLPQYKPAPITTTPAADIRTIGHSQRPHLWIYPQTNQGGHMLLPFINKEDWLDLTAASSLANMGKMQLISPHDLLNANSVSGQNVSIQIYAWAQDIKLCGPTISAAMQSDEYSTQGIISEPASAVAEAASLLESVPIIGPYATATSVIANAVSSVASWFGWTNVPVIEDVKPFKDLPFHSMASAEIGQPVEKLTLDPKNEVSIDPRTVGLTGDDELIIKDLVTKESFLGVSTWASASVYNTQLFAARITPEYYREETITSVTHHQSTPLAWLSKMFSYWRGDVIFRFRFICSKYHKGRVIFSWDPDANISSTAGSATTNYSRIVDISEEPDVEIRCNYMQATSFLRVQEDRAKTNLSFAAGAVSNHETTYTNGILTCRVFTQQTSPVASADIKILVSVRGAENLEFAGPKEISYQFSLYQPQAEEYYLDNHYFLKSDCVKCGETKVAKGVCKKCKNLLSRIKNKLIGYSKQSEELTYGAPPEVALTGPGTGVDDKNIHLVYMGETIKSLRQILRRTSLSRVSAFASNTTDRFVTLDCRRSRFPLYYGYELTNGVDTANELIGGATDKFNYVTQHPLNWVRMCFLGNRGSVRWMYNFEGKNEISNFRAKRIQVSRAASDYDAVDVAGTGLSRDQLVRQMTTLQLDSGASGQSVTNQRTQTGLAVEYPMYSRFRMLSNSATENTIGFTNDESDIDTTIISANIAPLTDTTGSNPINTLLYSYCSAGTDFTCLYFLNVPTLFHYSVVPTAP